MSRFTARLCCGPPGLSIGSILASPTFVAKPFWRQANIWNVHSINLMLNCSTFTMPPCDTKCDQGRSIRWAGGTKTQYVMPRCKSDPATWCVTSKVNKFPPEHCKPNVITESLWVATQAIIHPKRFYQCQIVFMVTFCGYKKLIASD